MLTRINEKYVDMNMWEFVTRWLVHKQSKSSKNADATIKSLEAELAELKERKDDNVERGDRISQ